MLYCSAFFGALDLELAFSEQGKGGVVLDIFILQEFVWFGFVKLWAYLDLTR